jgi:Fe-S-cluster-containing dehydrogenase component
MNETGKAGDTEQGAGPMTLSRRRILQLGLAAVPAACGATLLAGALASADGAARAAEPAPDAPPYDPSTHDWPIIDTTTCIGCGRCVEACKSRSVRGWRAQPDLGGAASSPTTDGHGDLTRRRSPLPTDDAAVPASIRDLLRARTCMRCENPPARGSARRAPRSDPGRVVLVDEKRCLGCGYCLVACPYGARYMVPAGETTPKGVSGIVDKCTFCYHRITRGMLPACAEVCPVNARIFGDLNDPASAVSVALAEKRVRVMKPALGTKPRVYYTGLEGEVE